MARTKAVKKSKWADVKITDRERERYYAEYFANGGKITYCPTRKASGHMPIGVSSSSSVDGGFDAP